MDEYRCGNCGKRVNPNVGKCPHCGVYLSGVKRVKYKKKSDSLSNLSDRGFWASVIFSIIFALFITGVNGDFNQPILGIILSIIILLIPIFFISIYLFDFFDDLGVVGWIIAMAIVVLIVHFAIFFLTGNMGFVI